MRERAYRRAIRAKRKSGRIKTKDSVRLGRKGMISINGKYSDSTTKLFLDYYEIDLDRFIRRVTRAIKEDRERITLKRIVNYILEIIVGLLIMAIVFSGIVVVFIAIAEFIRYLF